jgi:sigma54-dependent transcription regulator
VLRLTSSSSESPITKPEDGQFSLELSDGATLSYQVRGSERFGKTRPFVLVCGMSALMLDYERLANALSKTHTGKSMLTSLTPRIDLADTVA